MESNNTVMGLVSNAWAGLGAAFGPLVVMSLYWKRTNFPGAVAGIVTGALAVIIWDYILSWADRLWAKLPDCIPW